MISSVLLFPYYLVLKLRHRLYDRQALGCKVSTIDEVPTICVGNITAGGTGKTPHAEMILRVLKETDEWGYKKLAVLSRGYRRQTKGYLEVLPDGAARAFGDEPLQICRKFRGQGISVAVDADRVEGCQRLIESGKADLIVLDDAFQYRKLEAKVNIVLVNSHKPIFKDELLPLGRLRDLPERLAKADIVIVTKCGYDLTEEEEQMWAKKLKITPDQQLFFTTINYQKLQAVFPEADNHYLYANKAVLFSGIADDHALRDRICGSYKLVKRFTFADHHDFSAKDIEKIEKAAAAHPTAIVITTEKDAQRLLDSSLVSPTLRSRLFKLPINADFLTEEERQRFSDTLCELLGGPNE